MTKGELNLVGSISSPFRSPKAKIRAIKSGRWQPDSKDFDYVIDPSQRGKTTRVPDMYALMAAILESPTQCIDRLHLFTHAGPMNIALSGSVVVKERGTTVDFGDPELAAKSAMSKIDPDTGEKIYLNLGQITPQNIDLLMNQRTANMSHKTRKPIKLEDVRRRFCPKGAEFVVFACNAGSTKHGAPATGFLDQLATLLGVHVVAFKDEVFYCPKASSGRLFLEMAVGTDEKAACKGPTLKDFRKVIEKARAEGKTVDGFPKAK